MKISEVEKNISTAFVDLDGVIAWLDKGVADYNNISLVEQEAAGWDNEYWHNVLDTANIEQFFANLEWMPNGKNLVGWFQQRHLPMKFLTRPVKEPNEAACIAGKKKWLRSKGIGNIPVIFERDKEKYAVNSDGTVNILIDDHSGNVQKFSDAGGVGIHYRDFWFPDVIAKLENLYNL